MTLYSFHSSHSRSRMPYKMSWEKTICQLGIRYGLPIKRIKSSSIGPFIDAKRSLKISKAIILPRLEENSARL